MRRLLVATHGRFAEGIGETLRFILGESVPLETLSAYVTQDFDMAKAAKEYVVGLGKEDELLVAADVFGGSVANAFAEYVPTGKVHIITGLNLPLLMVLTSLLDSEESTAEMIQNAMEDAKEGITYVNQILNETMQEEEEDDF